MKKLLMTILGIVLTINFSNCADLQVESDEQHYNETTNKIDLQGDVKVKYDDINVFSPKAEVIINQEQNKVEKVKFLDNAYSYQVNQDKKHEIKAKILEASLLDKVFKATDRTQSTITKNNQPTIIVTADNQEYNNSTRIMKANGGVIVMYKDAQAFSDYAEVELDANNDIKKMVLSGHANIKKVDSNIKADKFVHYADKKITIASGNVYSDINEEEIKLKVWSDVQQLDQKSNIITASGHTIIHYLDFVAEGPKASVYPDDNNKLNKVIFIGRSKITQSGRTIEADRINLTLKPKDFKADGHVKTIIPNVSSNAN